MYKLLKTIYKQNIIWYSPKNMKFFNLLLLLFLLGCGLNKDSENADRFTESEEICRKNHGYKEKPDSINDENRPYWDCVFKEYKKKEKK